MQDRAASGLSLEWGIGAGDLGVPSGIQAAWVEFEADLIARSRFVVNGFRDTEVV